MVSGAQKPDKLVFNKAIVPSVQKSIPTKELLNRLKALSDELSAVDQDNVDVQSYKKIAADLANKKSLKNSNVGVQAYVCCCLSDILRIYAPDAPFTATELSSIFETFFQQLKFLADKENPYFLQQNYLLKRLAEVKSIILITDLPDSEVLIRQLFHLFYELSTKNFPTRLEPLVSDMLAEVIGECETIPMDVLKLILSTFLSSSSNSYSLVSAANSNISNPGFNFSLHICEANVHKMSRHVTQYFSEMLNDTAKHDGGQQDQQDGQGGVTFNNDNVFKTLEKIHKLSIQIWRSVPELLGSVMGLINDELNTDNEQVRILATSTIGSMIASSSSDTDNTAGFIMAHRSTWLNWLGKTMDISPLVRAKWVEQLPEIINSATISTSGISTELRNGLTKCLLDSSDKVRFIACRSLDKLNFEIFSSSICSKVVMNALFQLTREKNSDIRKKSIKILSEVYDNYHKSKSINVVINFGNHDEEEVAEIENLISEGIPNHILSLNYINDKDITMNVDITLFEKLLPFEVNSIKRVDRLAHFYSCLNEKSKASFTAICKRQQKQADALHHYVSLSEEYSKLTSDNIADEEGNKDNTKSSDDDESQSPASRKTQILNKLEKIMTWLSVSYPAGLNTKSCLDRLIKLKNYRFFNLIKFCISPESDYKTIKNSIKELLVKLSDAKYIRLENERVQVTTADMVSSLKILLYRASPILFNKANVAELINYSKDLKHEWYSVSNEILESISTIVPDVFKFHVKSLTELIIEGSDKRSDDPAFSPRTNNLRTIYHFIKKFTDCFPKSADFSESLKSISINGKPREARYAVKILGLSARKEFHASEIANAILPLNVNDEQLTTHLSCIAELYLVDPLSVEDHTESINKILIESILRSNSFSVSDAVDLDDDAWIDDINLDLDYKKYKVLYQKILGIRVIVNRLRALAGGSEITKSFQSDETLSAAAVKPLKLLTMLIASGGELVKQNSNYTQTPKYIRQKLRIHAGFSILKLAKYPKFQHLIDHSVINRLAVLLHDECNNIRLEFSKKLEVCLWNGELSENYLHLIFLMALEPQDSLKEQITTWIYSSHKRCIESKDIKFERILVRLIHCIAHNDTFKKFLNDENEDSDKRLVHAYSYGVEFIIFYLNTIAKQDNISLLYYFASRVKQYRDATVEQSSYSQKELPDSVLNTYRIAELTQLAIQVLNGIKHWNMQTWPGKIKLHADLYAPMETYEEAQKIISTVYIKDDLQAELRVLIKRRLNHSAKRKSHSHENSRGKRVKVDKAVRQDARANPAKKAKLKNGVSSKVKVSSQKKNPSASFEPSRKSSRSINKVSYVENSDSDGEGQESDYTE